MGDVLRRAVCVTLCASMLMPCYAWADDVEDDGGALYGEGMGQGAVGAGGDRPLGERGVDAGLLWDEAEAVEDASSAPDVVGPPAGSGYSGWLVLPVTPPYPLDSLGAGYGREREDAASALRDAADTAADLVAGAGYGAGVGSSDSAAEEVPSAENPLYFDTLSGVVAYSASSGGWAGGSPSIGGFTGTVTGLAGAATNLLGAAYGGRNNIPTITGLDDYQRMVFGIGRGVVRVATEINAVYDNISETNARISVVNSSVKDVTSAVSWLNSVMQTGFNGFGYSGVLVGSSREVHSPGQLLAGLWSAGYYSGTLPGSSREVHTTAQLLAMLVTDGRFTFERSQHRR
ncbi:MAG: hypothetical protein HFJ75_03940 [Eggerthellaceae bacterium]|nr:hypothetical protein [Eggerthellaceae bacterium]